MESRMNRKELLDMLESKRRTAKVMKIKTVVQKVGSDQQRELSLREINELGPVTDVRSYSVDEEPEKQ